jgi:ceramide glucosyltransferase
MSLTGAVAFAAVATGAAYLALAAVQLAAFARHSPAGSREFLPSITVLKPVAGMEPLLYVNLRSFCDQEYDAWFEVIFCLHEPGDPAISTIERVVAEFPARARIAIGENLAMTNPKIANLAKPGVDLRGDLIAIADSDIRVDAQYLRALAASFASERTGAATCLYAAIPNASIVSRLGALQIQDGFIPSVLAALALGKLRFCMGATMVVRRRVLEQIGGLAALGSVLADDHKLGELVTANGYNVDLSHYVVRTMVPETTLPALWTHELRWARTHFALAPAGYTFSFLMYALPLVLIYLAVAHNFLWGLPLLAVVVALRIAVHQITRRALSVSGPSDIWLVPVRDFLSLAVWFASFFGRRVRWRTRSYLAGDSLSA